MILPAWFDFLELRSLIEKFSYKKVCSPVKTSSLPVENIDEAPGKDLKNEELKKDNKSKEVMEITYMHASLEKVETRGKKQSTRSDANL